MEITMKKLVIVILLPIQTTFNSKLMTKKLILLFLNFPLFIFSQGIEITHGPYLQQMGENEATIIWTTNNDALSWVELAPIGNDSFYAFERPKYYETAYGSNTFRIGTRNGVSLPNLFERDRKLRKSSCAVWQYCLFECLFPKTISVQNARCKRCQGLI